MRMHEVMSPDVETIDPREDVTAARQQLSLHRIHHLIVAERGELVGILSSRDLKGVPGHVAVADVMSPKPITIGASETVRKAANLLRGHAIGCLPVVDGKKLIGIVTISDLLTLLGSGVERPVERGKRWTLKHRGPRRAQADRAHVSGAQELRGIVTPSLGG